MEKYIFVGMLIYITYIITGDIYLRIKKQKIILKSLKNSKIHYLFLSFIWLLTSYLNARLYYKYGINEISSDFTYIYIAILNAFVGVIWMIRSFQRDIINDFGICTLNKYKWKRIINYEWEEERQMQVKKEYIKYYNLTFFIRRTKLGRFFNCITSLANIDEKSTKKIIFQINEDSKDKVQRFLQDVFLLAFTS